MRRECIEAVGKAAGRLLSDGELKQLESEILNEYKRTPTDLSNMERLHMAGKAAKDTISKETAKVIHTAISDANIIASHIADIKNAPKGQSLHHLLKKLIFSPAAETPSTEFKQKAHVTEHTAGLAKFKKEHKNDIKADPKQFERDVYSIFMGDEVDNLIAKKFVDEYKAMRDKLHVEAGEVNIDFKIRKDRVPQHWDVDKMHAKGRDRFIEAGLDIIDKDHIAYRKADGSRQTDEWFTELLSNTYISKIESRSETFHSPYGGKVGEFRDKERVIHFKKDPEAVLKMREEFGSSKDVVDTLIRDVERLAKDVVMAREWGTRPETAIKKLIQDLHKQDMNATGGTKEAKTLFGGNRLDYQKNQLMAVLDTMLHGETTHNAFWGSAHAAIRSFMSSAHLGGHVIAAALEDGFISKQMLDRAGVDGETIRRFRQLPREDRVALASELSIMSEHSIATATRDMGSDLSSWSDTLHTLSGSEWLDKQRKSMHLLAVSEQIGKVLDKHSTLSSFFEDAQANPDLKRFMKQFTETDFEVMKIAERVSSPDGDVSMRSSKNIRDIAINNPVLRDIADQRVKEANPHYIKTLAKHEASRQRKIDAEANKIDASNTSKLSKYDQKTEALRANISLKDKERIKEIKTLQKEIKDLEARMASDIKIKKQMSRVKNPTADPKLVKQKMALHEKLHSLSSNKGRNQYLSKSREKAYTHQDQRSSVLEDLRAKKQEQLNPLENYKSEEIKSIQKHLTTELEKEASRIKNEVANKWNAILASNLQTSLRGASGTTLLDKHRLGLLTYKKGSIVGELLRYAEQYITTPMGMLFNAYDMHVASKSGAEASMNLEKIGRQYITTMAIAGIATATIKSVIMRGEDPTAKGALVDGVLTNGSLVPFGDKLYSLLVKKDAMGLLGATPSTVANITSSVAKGVSGEKGSGVSALKAARNAVPLANMWYIKAAFDHIFLNNLIETINPGYNERSQKSQESHGKSYFWNKNEFAPNRIPEPTLW